MATSEYRSKKVDVLKKIFRTKADHHLGGDHDPLEAGHSDQYRSHIKRIPIDSNLWYLSCSTAHASEDCPCETLASAQPGKRCNQLGE